jgi:predicted cupin superfamily sugar epimerase
VTAVSARELIDALGLLPHPEGGHYRETFRAPPLPFELPGRGPRSASTAIYFLLGEGDFSAFHRVRSDEVWHHYAGAPLELVTLSETRATGAARAIRLGPNVLSGEVPQAVVEAGVLQAARPAGPGFSLCGCTVAPGFDFSDFEMPERATLLDRFPSAADSILALTRA